MDSITLYNKYKWMQKERMNYDAHLGIFCNTFFRRMKRIFDQAIENNMLNETEVIGFYHRYIVYLLNYTQKTEYKSKQEKEIERKVEEFKKRLQKDFGYYY